MSLAKTTQPNIDAGTTNGPTPAQTSKTISFGRRRSMIRSCSVAKISKNDDVSGEGKLDRRTETRIPINFGEIELKDRFALSTLNNGVRITGDDFQFEISKDRIDLVKFVHHRFYVRQFVQNDLRYESRTSGNFNEPRLVFSPRTCLNGNTSSRRLKWAM